MSVSPHFDEHPIARREVEIVRPLDDEPRDIGGEHDARGDDASAPLVGEHGGESVQELAGIHGHRRDDPVPRRLGVERQDGEVGKVEEVREVKHL